MDEERKQSDLKEQDKTLNEDQDSVQHLMKMGKLC